MKTKHKKNQLIDSFGRSIEYLRLSVTDKCNLRCFYCLPQGTRGFESRNNWLTLQETTRIVRCFSELGVKRVRITGGEPLTRHDLPRLVKQLNTIPNIDDLSLSTNAMLLNKHAHELKSSGISRINVSLDSLKPKRFENITRGKLESAISGLMTAKEAGFTPIKINMVAMKNINDDEFEDMVEFCLENEFTLRFIETMPIGTAGYKASDHYLSLQEVKKKLSKTFTLIPSMVPGGGPARYFKVKDTTLRIGFITPISQHFCETCNRVRLTVDGTLYLCLGQEHQVALRPLLRQGISDTEIKETLIKALTLKPERHNFSEKPQRIIHLMSHLGG